MTRRDKIPGYKLKPRRCVSRYFAFKDKARALGISLPECNFHVIFVIPMPGLWPKKKKNLFRGKPHQQTPDKDNLEKALLDAIFKEDKTIYDGRVSKIWGDEGFIVVMETEPLKPLNEYLENEKAKIEKIQL